MKLEGKFNSNRSTELIINIIIALNTAKPQNYNDIIGCHLENVVMLCIRHGIL